MDRNAFDDDVRTAIYGFFVEEGHAPVAAEVAEILSATPAAVEAALRRLHDAHVLVLAPGTPYIWMANPFSALPTPYAVHAQGNVYWGNCIWDALGIVAMLGTDGVVSSLCPDCGARLLLEVKDDRLSSDGQTVHYAVPAAQWWDDIGFN